MAGHSKWAAIKHKKAIVDARRGKLFTKLARAITVAAREGGGDVDGNPSLALAVQKAKDASMPKDNIERAIAKGTGAGADADALETVLYEGYGPGGVALLVEALTDNRNRTGAEVRHMLQQGRRQPRRARARSATCSTSSGVLVVDAARYDEDDLHARHRGRRGGHRRSTTTSSRSLDEPVRPHRRARGARGGRRRDRSPPTSPSVPKSRVPVDEDTARKLLRLIDALEDNDDVDAVHANFDVDAEVLERVMASASVTAGRMRGVTGRRPPGRRIPGACASSASIPAPPTPATAWSRPRPGA